MASRIGAGAAAYQIRVISERAGSDYRIVGIGVHIGIGSQIGVDTQFSQLGAYGTAQLIGLHVALDISRLRKTLVVLLETHCCPPFGIHANEKRNLGCRLQSRKKRIHLSLGADHHDYPSHVVEFYKRIYLGIVMLRHHELRHLVPDGHLLNGQGKGVPAGAEKEAESEQKYKITVHIFQESANLA